MYSTKINMVPRNELTEPDIEYESIFWFDGSIIRFMLFNAAKYNHDFLLINTPYFGCNNSDWEICNGVHNSTIQKE